MNKEQAIKIIDQALAQANTTREGHALLIKALEVLKNCYGDNHEATRGTND
jgi:hypothetical protein